MWIPQITDQELLRHKVIYCLCGKNSKVWLLVEFLVSLLPSGLKAEFMCLLFWSFYGAVSETTDASNYISSLFFHYMMSWLDRL